MLGLGLGLALELELGLELTFGLKKIMLDVNKETEIMVEF